MVLLSTTRRLQAVIGWIDYLISNLFSFEGYCLSICFLCMQWHEEHITQAKYASCLCFLIKITSTCLHLCVWWVKLPTRVEECPWCAAMLYDLSCLYVQVSLVWGALCSTSLQFRFRETRTHVVRLKQFDSCHSFTSNWGERQHMIHRHRFIK